MLETAWLLAAIELNGALISRGANAQLTDQHCAVEARVIAPALSEKDRRAIQGEYWITDAQHCSFSDADGLLRIRLPQESLASKSLLLGENTSSMSVAMLHDPTVLSQQTETASQPSAQSIPSAAFDLFVGSRLRGLGTVLTHGPWSVQVLQQNAGGTSALRGTAEYLFRNGAQIRLGDFRTDHGPEQSFGEYRGLLLTNRAAPLRGDGKAEAQLSIRSPSRVQFFDRNGLPIYSSEILPPGNYQIQGFGASTVPGFLEARIVDINGVTQSVSLPWSADRRLLSHSASEWELFAGHPRQLTTELTSPPLLSARVRHGLSQHLTVGLHAETLSEQHRFSFEASSRAMPSVIATAAVGHACDATHCQANWIGEARATLAKGLSALASVGNTTALVNDNTLSSQRTAQLSISGAMTSALTASVHLANSRLADGPRQHTQTISASLRIDPQISLLFQARHHLLEKESSGWSGFIGVSVHFSKHHTSVASYANLRSLNQGSKSSSDGSITTQANLSSPQLYGPQLNFSNTHDLNNNENSRNDLFARYASPYGDVSLRNDSVSHRTVWSGATRLWVTRETTTFAPMGEENLVIQKLGLGAVRIAHPGRDTQVSDEKGVALFKKAPSWTETIYAIDPRSIPFGFNLAASRVRIPLATNRAYVVDYRNLWSMAQSWRIAHMDSLKLPENVTATDRHGRKVFIAGDGFVDLQSADHLPLRLANRDGEAIECVATDSAVSPGLIAREVMLHCQRLLAL